MHSPAGPKRNIPPLFFWGVWMLLFGGGLYVLGIFVSMVRLVFLNPSWMADLVGKILWVSSLPTTLGVVLIAADLLFLFPKKRKTVRRVDDANIRVTALTVALTAYNDEESIAKAVADFSAHPLVRRVIVVDNNSTDLTGQRAREAGAIVFNELKPGYGYCVWRCLSESTKFEDTEYVVLCEGDLTFRAFDLDKFVAYLPHADIVNGTRIVEQLRAYSTQLSTFMYYGNFFAGKLLETKHLGKGTFTDVGTTYKVMARSTLERLLPYLDPRINLEFNAYFMDVALENGFTMLECPITFHPRVGFSKGGNVNNLRALKVGLRMIAGLTFGWRAHRP